MTRAVSDELKGFIKRREAPVLSPHWDAIAQVWDIGYGHRYKDGEPHVPITKEEADALFDIDILYYADKVAAALTVEVPQPIFDALVSFCYNVGGGAMASSGVIAFVNAGMHADACVALLEWRKSRGADIDGLLLRRAKEAVMYATGVYLP